MNFLSLFVLFVFISTAHGWAINGKNVCFGWCWWSKRGLKRNNYKRGADCDAVERRLCARTCTETAEGMNCHFSCASDCEGQEENESTKGSLMPFTVDFNSYDCQNQGRFSVGCLAALYGAGPTDPGVQETFDAADKNKDGFVTPDELKKAQWIFEGREKELAKDTGTVQEPPKPLTKLVREQEEAETPEEGNAERDLNEELRLLRRLLNQKRYK